MKYRRNYIWMIAIIVAFALIKLKIGGSVPLPPSYQTLAGGQIRIQVHKQMAQTPTTGEAWTLQKHEQNNQVIYTANLFNNGRELMLFPGASVVSKNSSGTTYTASGKIRFASAQYQAVKLYVAADGKSGYIDFAKTTNAKSANS